MDNCLNTHFTTHLNLMCIKIMFTIWQGDTAENNSYYILLESQSYNLHYHLQIISISKFASKNSFLVYTVNKAI